jgi:hypothetical protein
VDLIIAHLCQAEPVGRPVEVLSEFGDRVHVTALRHRRQGAHLHVLDHAAAQWRRHRGNSCQGLQGSNPDRPIAGCGHFLVDEGSRKRESATYPK